MSEEGLRVLLVDDEASLRKPLARYLGNMYGYHVDTAANEEEAWERVLRAEWPYDVALIDDLLTPKPGAEPEPIGIGLMARIRQNCPETECIIFTGWGMDRALEALQAGAYRYLAKPLNLDELGMTIRMAAEQGRLRRERDLLSATLGISGAMLSELDVQKTLEVITEAVTKLVGAEACAVALLDHATGKVRYDPIIPLGDATVKWHRHLREVQLTKQITEMGESFILSDVAAEAKRVDENLRLAGVKSFAGVPIPGKPQNLGVLYAYSIQREAFGTHERHVLQLLAGQAAIALKNARLFADTQKSAQTSEALYRTGHALSSYLEEEPVIRAILEAVYRTLGCEHVLISTVDDEAETIGIRHGIWQGKFDVFPEWIEMSQYSLDHPDILTDIYRTGCTEIIKGWDERFNREIYDEFGHERFLRIFMPIKTRDEVIGVVEVGYDKREKGLISEDEVQLLAAFMDQAAVALENARLFDTTRRASEQLSALDQVVLEIGRGLDQRTLLRKVIEQAMELLLAEGGGVYLLDPTGEYLTLRTAAGLPPDLEGQRIGKNEGLTGEIMQTGEPQKIADYYCWEKRLRILDAQKLTGVAGAPIRAGGRILGTLVVHDTRPCKQFDDKALALLQQFANHVGLALQKAALLEKLWAIQQISTTITSPLDLRKVLNHTCQAAVELFGADHSGLVLFDQDLEWGTVEGEYPAQTNTLGERIPIKGVPVEEKLAFNGRTLVFTDVEKAASELGPVLDILRRFDIRSILIVPIIYQDRVLGSFSLDAVSHARKFTAEEVEFCKVFAAHVAVAVENARLFSELAETKEWREALIENAFDAVIAIDQDAKIMVFNQRAEGMFGWTAGEMIGQTVARLHVDVAKAMKIFEVVNEEGTISGWQVELKHRDGTRIPALLSATLIRDSQGDNPIGQAGFIRDLRQVLLLEERLRALIRVSQAITGALELDKVLNLIVESTVDAFPTAQNATIHLYDERADTLRVRAITLDYSAEALKALNLKVGEGIAGWVFQNQQPLVVNDIRQDSRYKRIDHPEVRVNRSMICVPLRVRERVIGTLSLNNSDIIDAFQPEDLGLLASFADQAAVAIENAKLYRETRVGRERLRSFYEASNTLVSSQDLEQVLQDIVEQARVAAQARGVHMILIDKAGQARKLITAGTDKPISIEDMVREKGLSMELMRTGQSIVIEDINMQRDRVNPSMFWRKIIASLGLPVVLEGERIGVMWFLYSKPCRFSTSEIEAVQLYVNQAALAYDSARRIKELEHMRQAAEALAGSASLQEVLEQIVQSAREVLQADSAAIWSYDNVRDRFILESSVSSGIPVELWQEFCEEELRLGRTAYTVMEQVWIGVSDVANTERYGFLGESTRELLDQVGVQSFQGLALMVGDEKLGVLYVNYNCRRSFHEKEQEIARMFANHAALALKNARLLEQVRKARDAAKIVAEVSILGDLEQTLHSVVEGTQEALGCDAVVLFVYDQVTNKLGHPPTMAGVRYRDRASRYGEVLADSIVYEMLRGDEPYIVEAVAQDPLFRDRRFAKDEGIESCVAVPLKTVGQKVGVMFVNYRSHHRFTDEEFTNIGLLSYQAAVAIRNAQLYDETIRRANALEALYEAGKAVTSTLALDEILNRIVKQAWRFTGQWGKRARFSDLELREGIRLKCKAAYPPEHLVRHQRTVGDIDLEHDERIGVIGRAAKTGQSQLVGDVTQDLDYIEYDPETRSELAVPIRLGEEVIGVINVEHPDFNAFDEEDQKALESLAAQAAIAIENARLFRETEHRALQLAAASEVARDATAILDVERLLDETVCLISERFGFYHAGVFLLDDKREYAVLHAASSEGGRRMLERGHKLKVGEVGIVGFVTDTGEPRIALDVGEDAVHFANPDLPDTRSEMALPLTVGGQIIGTLDVQSTEVGAFTDGDVATLQIMADQLANAIENARLYEKQQQEAKQLALINQIAAEISSSLDLEKFLQTLVDELAQVIGVEQCAIAIFDEKGEYADVVAEYLEAGCVTAKGVRIPLRDNPTIEIVRKTKRPLAVKDAQHDPRMEKVWDIMKQRRTQSIMIVPIVIGHEVIGTIGLDAVSSSREFTEEEKWLAETIAYHAAIAIQNARQFRLREGLLKAGELVTAEGELYPALGVIAQSVKETIGCDVVCLYTYDEKKREISYPSVVVGELYKPQERADWQLVSQERKLQVDLLGERSVIGTLLEYGSSRFAFCSAKDPILGAGEFAAREGIESSAGILLKIGEEVVGILFVNYRSAHRFSDEEKQAAELFAVQTALTIQSAWRYEELKKIKGFVGARTAIDWMRMVSTAWGHGIRREVGTSLGHMALLRGLLAKGESAQELEKELDQLENAIKGIKEIPITAPLSYEDAVDSVQINDLVKTYLERQWKHVRYRPVKLYYELQEDLDSIATVRASRQWLRRALEILVDNSVQAMLEADSPEKRLTVTTQLVGKTVEISVKDTGPGISKDVLEKLFREPIDKPVGSRGAGVGLILAQTIVQTYGGDIRIELPADGGTNVVIILRVEDKVSK